MLYHLTLRPLSSFASLSNNVLCSKKMFAFRLSCLFSLFQAGTVLQCSLRLLVMTLLKTAGQLFCSMFLHSGLSEYASLTTRPYLSYQPAFFSSSHLSPVCTGWQPRRVCPWASSFTSLCFSFLTCKWRYNSTKRKVTFQIHEKGWLWGGTWKGMRWQCPQCLSLSQSLEQSMS